MKTYRIPGALALAFLGVGGYLLAGGSPPEAEIASYATPLRGRTPGQRHNAVLALRHLDGAVIGPGEVLSFNERVGSWTRDRGFRKAPVSYNGQLVLAWGGGVCQTSSTLYNAALLAGLQVIERHPHVFAPEYVPPGRDAAVAWPSVDLAIGNPHPFPVRIEGEVRLDQLVVRIVGPGRPEAPIAVESEVRTYSPHREYELVAGREGRMRVRSSGRPGFDVLVWRIAGSERELVSRDVYQPMHRVVEYR